jgi:hypothetical protein
MKKIAGGAALLALGCGLCLASQEGGTATFTGSIGDSMCGLKHVMPGGDKACTQACIKEGSSYVLVDSSHNRVYKLSDQSKSSKYPGERVKVTGTLKGDTIQVSSLDAAN